MIAGDFNDITSNSKKWGGRCRVEWSFNDFKNFISANQLVDLGYEGQPWTWCNNWGNEEEIKQRLHRAMSSADWIKTFENAKCSHIKTSASDHCALMIDTKPTVERKNKGSSLIRDGSNMRKYLRLLKEHGRKMLKDLECTKCNQK